MPKQGGGWERTTQNTQQNLVESQVSRSPERETTQYDKNRELLRNSEMGVLLDEVYKSAVKIDPRLANIEIIPIDPSSERGEKYSAFAHMTEDGKYQINIRIDSIDQTLNLVKDALEDIPGLEEMIKNKLLLDKDTKLTPLQMHTLTMLHEMGHLVEYMDEVEKEGNIEALRRRNKEAKDKLPLHNIKTL